ncbi:MAG: energy-coupling factor ABC transporter substrate-binding protein [Clostridiales bacterium]|nr:MAG: energy-coupling factor ABC transporter substrate-binding protein [Clostridiales bacterium]
MKNAGFFLGILALIVVIILAPFVLAPAGSEFGGSDGEGEGAITEIHPDYEPWAESPIELPSGEIESMLFSLQAAFGSAIIFYSIGYLKGKKVGKEQSGKAA